MCPFGIWGSKSPPREQRIVCEEAGGWTRPTCSCFGDNGDPLTITETASNNGKRILETMGKRCGWTGKRRNVGSEEAPMDFQASHPDVAWLGRDRNPRATPGRCRFGGSGQAVESQMHLDLNLNSATYLLGF